jgi:outer membrane receptor protein involved in Fe transport
MGYPYTAYMRVPEEYGGESNRISAFIDDSWTVSDRLTLNLGLRYDRTRGGYPEFNIFDRFGNPTGEKTAANMDLLKWDTVSPRLGIAYQLTADRKTVLRASYGRYYDHMLIRDYDNGCPSHSALYGYYYNWDTGAYDILFWYRDPLANIGIDSNLKNPYTDQFSLGFERELFPEISLTASFIYKKSRDAIATYNTGGLYEMIDYYDEYGGQTIQVYNQINSSADNFYFTTNPGDYSNYKGFVLAVEKRLSHNWQMNANLTIAKARDFPIGYSDPNDNINMFGVPSYYDRAYQFKVNGSYFFPYGINVSVYFSNEQGRPFNRTVRVRLDQGSRSIAAEEMGSKRYPNQTFLDMRIEKEIRVWNDHRLKLLIDIWNLLNRAAYRNVVNTLAESPNYLVGTTYDLPRRAQIGIRYVF